MNNGKKKTAPEAGTPETAQLKNNLNISITDNPEKIKVVVQEPGKISEIATVVNDLKPMHELIGGYLETLTLPNGLVLVMDEEGRLKGLRENVRCVQFGTIVGRIFITAAEGESFRSLTVEEIQSARAWLLKHSV